MRDWIHWHRAYDDPNSDLSRRLDHVVAATRSAIDAAPIGPVRILSLCSGDARDICRAIRDHPRRTDVSGCAVELDPDLAATASVDLASAAIDIAVRCGDAGDTQLWRDVLPADVVVLAGIFGNISDADVQRTIGAVPSICRAGATIVWTRHRQEPDLTPAIDAWFAESGCVATSLASPGRARYAVGSHMYLHVQDGRPLDGQLFHFVDNA